MSDEQHPATDLERAVHEFLRHEHQEITLGRPGCAYAVVPVTAITSLRWAIDPDRPAPRPFVSFDPAMKGGQATVNGTRLTVANLAEHVWIGEPETAILDGWGLTRGDVLVACWYRANHGGRTWRKRWGAWAASVFLILHRTGSAGDYSEIEWPPTMRDVLGAPDAVGPGVGAGEG